MIRLPPNGEFVFASIFLADFRPSRCIRDGRETLPALCLRPEVQQEFRNRSRWRHLQKRAARVVESGLLFIAFTFAFLVALDNWLCSKREDLPGTR
ncbi:MAG: hypothetical protein IPJ58_19220, partial [Ardenticatenia bacterium]|nr:hypothetical protein [Ardenticatenia bacterium]